MFYILCSSYKFLYIEAGQMWPVSTELALPALVE